MPERTIGKFISDIREKQGIQQQELCEGLCSKQLMSQIEYDESIPDLFLFECLIQRLGKSPDKFEIILFDSEFELLEKRAEIERMIEVGKFEVAEELLEKYIAVCNKKDHIQYQFYYQIKAIIEHEKGNLEGSINCLLDAIRSTVIDFDIKKKRTVLFCVREIELMLMLAEEYFLNHDRENAEKISDFLINYLEDNYQDEEELVKVYPKAIYLRLKYCISDEKRLQYIKQAEEALQLLAQLGSTVFLAELMEILIDIYRQINLDKKAIRLEKQVKTLKEVLSEFSGISYVTSMKFRWFKESQRRQYCLFSEMIRCERLAREISQEKFIEDGIYDTVVSLSRIETGKRNPSREKFNDLMEKLGFEKQKYWSSLVTDAYDVLEIKQRISNLSSKQDYENTRIELERLRFLLNENEPANKQYLAHMDAVVRFKLGVIDAKELYEQSLKALKITYTTNDEKILRVPTLIETYILNQLAIALYEMRKTEEGIELYWRIKQCMENSKLGITYYPKSLGVITENYMIMLEEANRLEESYEALLEDARGEVETFRAAGLNVCLSERMSLYEKSTLDECEKKKNMEKYLRHAFYMSDLFMKEKSNKVYDAYYRKRIDKDVEWY